MADKGKVSDIGRARGSGSQLRSHQHKFPPETFIIPGQDNNGNSVRLHCRVMPLLAREVSTVHASHKFPFKTPGDLIRWCVKVGVERLQELDPSPGSMMAQVDMMIAVLNDEEKHRGFMTLFNTMSETVSAHIQVQAMGEARRVIHEMKNLIEKIDNEYWRNRCKQELEAKFGHLLRGSLVAGAGLGEHQDSGPDTGRDGIDED